MKNLKIISILIVLFALIGSSCAQKGFCPTYDSSIRVHSKITKDKHYSDDFCYVKPKKYKIKKR